MSNNPKPVVPKHPNADDAEHQRDEAPKVDAAATSDPSEDMSQSQVPAARPAPLPDPQGVLQDPTLTRDEKIEKLRRWSTDAQSMETANAEGMGGVLVPSNLQAVQEALLTLVDVSTVPPPTP